MAAFLLRLGCHSSAHMIYIYFNVCMHIITGRQRSACHSCLCLLSSAACADGLSFVARHGSDGQETAAGATATATTHVRHLTRSGGAVFSLGRNVIASKVCQFECTSCPFDCTSGS